MALFAKSCDNSANTLSMFVRRLLITLFSLDDYLLDNQYLVIFFRFSTFHIARTNVSEY